MSRGTVDRGRELMARGFESKDVEFQQAEAERRSTPAGTPLSAEDRARANRRRTLELALSSARADLAAARSEAHKKMLAEAIAALEQQLSADR